MKSHKKRWKDKGNPRYRLNSDEAQIINDYRRLKLEAEARGFKYLMIYTAWIKNKKPVYILRILILSKTI